MRECMNNLQVLSINRRINGTKKQQDAMERAIWLRVRTEQILRMKREASVKIGDVVSEMEKEVLYGITRTSSR